MQSWHVRSAYGIRSPTLSFFLLSVQPFWELLGGYVFMLFNCGCWTLANCSSTCRCLMIAGPGTGKTWSSCQLMYHLSKASVVLFLLLSHGFLTCWLVGNRLIPHSAQLQDQHQSQLCHRQACAQNTDSTGIVKMPALIFAQKLAGDPVALCGTAQRFMYF